MPGDPDAAAARASGPWPSTPTPTRARRTSARPTLAVHLGPAPAYLSVAAVVGAARRAGAQAVHPGYGFLSENAAFAAACEAAGIAFVGPPPDGHRGDGRQDPGQADRGRGRRAGGARIGRGRPRTTRRWPRAVAEIGFPVLVKPSAGGGGKGMREVHRAEDLADAISAARREARGSFGDGTLLVERLRDRPPAHRDPGPRRRARERDPPGRARVLAAAAAPEDRRGGARRRCWTTRSGRRWAPPRSRRPARSATSGPARWSSSSAADRPDEFFFMEMNTRLQVEHPVTEEVIGLDLVELQLRVAAGRAASRGRRPAAGPRARDRGPDLRRGPGGGLPAHRRPRLRR